MPPARPFPSLLLALLASAGCQGAATSRNSETGPRIVLDTAELHRARQLRAGLSRELDSLAHDTSATVREKAREEGAFFALMHQGRLASTQETLARLGYGIRMTGVLDAPTRNAIREFERYHGLPDSSDVDAPELALAIDFVDHMTSSQFPLPELRVLTSAWAASVHAEGTWQGADPPRQTSEIWCYRFNRTCHESYAYILMGALRIGTTDYDVELWNDDELRARSDAICVSDVLSINRASEAVILVRSSRNQREPLCKDRHEPTDDIAMRLVNGRLVTDSLDKAARPYMRYGKTVSDWIARTDSIAKAK